MKDRLLNYVRQVTQEPGVRRGNDVYFHSPLHKENTASFKVNISINKWHDFGTNESGDVFDLIMKLQSCSYKNAVFFLSQGNILPLSEEISLGKEKDAVEVKEIASTALISYARERCVSVKVLSHYCKEIHQGKFFYIGFQSQNGGWELRNMHFKGCVGKKDFSLIANGSNEVLVFEGFFDFLSFATFISDEKLKSYDVLVLNSVALVEKSVETLQKYKTVHCYLDNDNAGNNATQYIAQKCQSCIDHSSRYHNFNDVNDYIKNTLGKKK